ncbi:MAG TPA: hypothetical protein VFB79_14890 [Candidatus Angelobacter sp.]|nr:hypothetical protein [Candidatus Angelobacter sp.]
MSLIMRILTLLFAALTLTSWAGAQHYPSIKAQSGLFEVPDVKYADVLFDIKSLEGTPVYRLQCHSAEYSGDDHDFAYSGDFECRLSSVGHPDIVASTLLTEDAHQSRDWESRGRFFAKNLRGSCASIPDFGAVRRFKLRGIDLTLEIIDPRFTPDGTLQSLKLSVKVHPDASANRAIAAVVPLPKTPAARKCKIKEDFIDPVLINKEGHDQY